MASVLRYIVCIVVVVSLDSDTRQDVYNYLGEEGCVGNLFDKEDFYVRKPNTHGVVSKHPQHGELFGSHAFTIRGNYERFAIRNCVQWVALGELITRRRKPLKTLNKVQFVCVCCLFLMA